MADKINRSENKYNPEGSKLRTDQKELFRMLCFVDKICKENGICWWLSSGTLLGAARHKGFIPWDDDMDIVMLRKDLKRLEKILVDLDSEEFVYHCIKTDFNYVNYFGKFRKRQGTINVANIRYKYYRWRGIGLDIFGIEKINSLAVRIGNRIYSKTIHITDHIKNDRARFFITRIIQFLNFDILFPLLRLLGKYNPRQEYHYVLGTGWGHHTFYIKDMFPLTTAVFEGIYFPVPHDTDAYLTKVYGNWRIFPSEEDIRKSIHCQEYLDEIYNED